MLFVFGILYRDMSKSQISFYSIYTLERVTFTPAVYPRLIEFLQDDIQSTGQKSHCVNIVSDHHNALF